MIAVSIGVSPDGVAWVARRFEGESDADFMSKIASMQKRLASLKARAAGRGGRIR